MTQFVYHLMVPCQFYKQSNENEYLIIQRCFQTVDLPEILKHGGSSVMLIIQWCQHTSALVGRSHKIVWTRDF